MRRERDDNESTGITRFLGLDIGDRRIGLALSDPLEITAQPFGVLERTNLKTDLEELSRICVDNNVRELVVGLPTNQHGEIGPQAEKVMGFIGRLGDKTGLPVHTWDERFTTVAAERALRDGSVSGRKRKGLRDRMAAQLILQGYMDARHSPGRSTSENA